jgi:vitamin B12 transporter
LVSALAVPAQAQEIELDEIVVTAVKAVIERIRTGVSVAVLNPEADAVPDSTQITESLARLPGVSVSKQGPLGSPAKMRIRGADQRYIAVFVDGIRVTDPAQPQTEYDFGTLPSAGIGRIEVLRGSQSALWGGSAVGGVVNISTPRPTEDGTRQTVQAEAGSYDSRSLSYGLTHKQGALESTLNLSHFFTNGFSAAAAGTEADGAETNRASATLRYQVNGSLALGGAVFRQKTTSEFDGYALIPYDGVTYIDPNPTDAFTSGYFFVDLQNTKKSAETGMRAFAELSLGNTEHMFDVTSYAIGRDISDENGIGQFDGQRTTFSWQATTELNDALILVYGADTMLENANYSNLPGGIADTRISGAFSQALWAANSQMDISATARIDRNSTFGSFPNGRLALAYRPEEGTTIRASVASGYRAPSIDERFGDYPSLFFVGNPDLTPEKSFSYELGFERAFGNDATLSATLFRLEVKNLITSTEFFDSLENISGTSMRQGLEVGGSMPMGERATLGLAYTYTDARRPDRYVGEKRIGLVPYHELVLSLEGSVTDRLSSGLWVKHAAGRLDDFGNVPMPDFTVVNAEVGYKISDTAEAYLRIENLFDEDYQTSAGYGTSGRAAFVGLRAKF